VAAWMSTAVNDSKRTSEKRLSSMRIGRVA
jgi:hypothetical protein